MNRNLEKSESQKTQIVSQIAALSRLLGMLPSDDTIRIIEPMTQNEMTFSDWLSDARDSFFKLSVLISRELNIELQ